MTKEKKKAQIKNHPVSIGKFRKVYLYILAFVVVILAIVIIFIRPVFLGIKADSQELLLQKSNLALRTEETKGLAANKEFYANNSISLLDVENRLIDANIPIDLVTFLEESASSVGVSIDIAPGVIKDRGEDRWPTIDLLLSVSGPSLSFIKFLDKVENAPYFIDIISLNAERTIDGSKDREASRDIKTSLSISVLTRK